MVEMIEPLEERLTGRYTFKKSVKHPGTGEVIVGPHTFNFRRLQHVKLSKLVLKKSLALAFTCNTRTWCSPSLLRYQLATDAVSG